MVASYYLDIAVLLIYFVLCLCIGLYKTRKVNSLKAFALGETTLPLPILITTIIACSFGAGSTIGYSGQIFNHGTLYILCLMCQPIYWLITAWIFGKSIEKFRGCLSISEVMFKLYGIEARWITSITALGLNIGIIGAHASAVGYVFHYFFGIDLVEGILLSFGILTIYSALGGIRAVVLTEVLQFGIFYFVLPISFFITLNNLGGAEVVMSKLPLADWGMKFSLENLPFAASLIFYILLPNVMGPAIQRYLMVPNQKQLKFSLYMVALIMIPLQVSIFIIAYIVKSQAPDINPADTFVYYIANFLPLGIKSLMITGIIAIIMSVAESFLNTSSVIIVNDMIKVLYPKLSTQKQLLALRLSVFLVSIFSIYIALSEYGILSLILLVQNFWTAIILVPLCAGFLGFRTDSRSFTISVVPALLLTLLGRYIAGEFDMLSMSLGCMGSALGLFCCHFQHLKTKSFKELKLKSSKQKLINIID